jgi:hypothetical protein
MSIDGSEYRAPNYALPSDEVFAYGGESIQIKKLFWPDGYNSVRYGAIFHNNASGENYFVTQEDLCRYEITEAR